MLSARRGNRILRSPRGNISNFLHPLLFFLALDHTLRVSILTLDRARWTETPSWRSINGNNHGYRDIRRGKCKMQNWPFCRGVAGQDISKGVV